MNPNIKSANDKTTFWKFVFFGWLVTAVILGVCIFDKQADFSFYMALCLIAGNAMVYFLLKGYYGYKAPLADSTAAMLGGTIGGYLLIGLSVWLAYNG